MEVILFTQGVRECIGVSTGNKMPHCVSRANIKVPPFCLITINLQTQPKEKNFSFQERIVLKYLQKYFKSENKPKCETIYGVVTYN
jgi:hypothetical protein